MIYILVVTVGLYRKLFQALCKIHVNSLTWRLKQIEYLAMLFEENIEDDITYFNDFHVKINLKQNNASGVKNVSTYTGKEYKDKSLVFFGLKYILIACALTGIVIGLISNSFHISIQSFKDLNDINDRIMASFNLNSRVKIVTPAFYFAVIFKNDTSYKIKNQDATLQFLESIEAVGDSNQDLLEAVSNSHDEIDDPIIEQILRGKACEFVSDLYHLSCVQHTNDQAFGLLGLQPKFYSIMSILKNWAISDNPTMQAANDALTQVSAVMNNLYFVIYELYDVLANHLIDSFLKRAEDQRRVSWRIFYTNVALVLSAMFLIRVIVLKKLRALDIGIRRILRLVPYKIIEENKVMSFYLMKTFGKELDVLRCLVN